jgi:hypothetical protein
MHVDVVCEDDNLCTRDLCCQDNGCYFAPICCDDQNACTVDSCDPYLGCLNVKISCDDGDACTIDRCHCDEGCQHFPVNEDDNPQCKGHQEESCTTDIDCQDSSECTLDVCKGGKCLRFAVDCDDGDLCTVDSCNAVNGCQYEWIESPACSRIHDDVHTMGVIVHDMEEGKEIMGSDNIQAENQSANEHHGNVLGSGPIAGIVVGVVALVAILGLVGYKLSQKRTITATVSDNAYTSM